MNRLAFELLSPLRKVETMKLPQRHQDTKIHKEFIINDLHLVQLCAFVPWWQKKYSSEWTQ